MAVVTHSGGSVSASMRAPAFRLVQCRYEYPQRQRVRPTHDDGDKAHRSVHPARVRELVDVQKHRCVHRVERPEPLDDRPAQGAARGPQRAGFHPHGDRVGHTQDALVERVGLFGGQGGQSARRSDDDGHRLLAGRRGLRGAGNGVGDAAGFRARRGQVGAARFVRDGTRAGKSLEVADDPLGLGVSFHRRERAFERSSGGEDGGVRVSSGRVGQGAHRCPVFGCARPSRRSVSDQLWFPNDPPTQIVNERTVNRATALLAVRGMNGEMQ